MSETITIAVVRLSKMALRKKVAIPIIHISTGRREVEIRRVSTSKPLCASITSTMVMAPIRKKTICAVPVSDSANSALTAPASGPARAYSTQSAPEPSRAAADLLTPSGCSKTIAA